MRPDGSGEVAAAPDAEAVRLDSRETDSGRDAGVADLAADADGPVSADEHSQHGAEVTGQSTGQPADGPGPLALAASAAREAAEARIRAALHQTRRSGLEPPYQLENPYPSATFDVTDLTPPQPSAVGSAGAAGAWGAAAIRGSVTRPEAASGAQAWAAGDLRPEAGSPHSTATSRPRGAARSSMPPMTGSLRPSRSHQRRTSPPIWMRVQSPIRTRPTTRGRTTRRAATPGATGSPAVTPFRGCRDPSARVRFPARNAPAAADRTRSRAAAQQAAQQGGRGRCAWRQAGKLGCAVAGVMMMLLP